MNSTDPAAAGVSDLDTDDEQVSEFAGTPAALASDDPPSSEPQDATPAQDRRRVTVRPSTVAWTAALAVAVAVAATFLILWLGARSTIADGNDRVAAERHAEQVAGDYALGAATVNYQNIGEWAAKLKAGTTPELAAKFDATAPKLTEVLTPLKWTSTATPMTAKVMSEANGVYKVSVFLTVTSTNAQNPTGSQATVTYSVSLDSRADWKITDVGGMDGALPVK